MRPEHEAGSGGAVRISMPPHWRTFPKIARRRRKWRITWFLISIAKAYDTGWKVEAESLYEAAVLALRTFKQHDCAPAEMTKLELEIRSSVVHETTVKRVREWLSGGARSPKLELSLNLTYAFSAMCSRRTIES
jgi:hypothetical protein